MKLTCLPEQMASALSISAKVAAKRLDALPILEHVLIETTPDGAGRITATDLRATVVAPFACRVDEPGCVAVQPDGLGSFLDLAVKGEPLTLASDVTPGGAVKVGLTSGTARARLPGMHGEDFPAQRAVEGASFRLSADAFKEALGSVLHGVAPDESRPVLAGVHCVIRGQMLTLEAVDGFRGATRQVEVDACDEDVDAIITGRGLRLALASLQSGEDVRITLDRDGKDIEIVAPAARWTIGAIEDGVFPNLKQMLDRPMTGTITCSREDLKRAISLAMAFGRSRGEKGGFDNLVALRIGDASIDVVAANPEAYQSGDLRIDHTSEGAPKSVAFNAAYLRDAVNALGSDRVTIEIPEGYSLAIVREPGPRNGHIQYVGPMSEKALQRIMTWREEVQ
jgi:DNA polymerase-3 subunit beta